MSVPYEVAERINFRKADYCRFVDTLQWDAFQALFTPDATFTFYDVNGNVIQHFETPKILLEKTLPLLGGVRTSHQVTNAQLTKISDKVVSAVWAMQDHLIFPPQEGERRGSLHGYGHYHDMFELRDGDWYITKVELTRVILEFSDGPGPMAPLFQA